MEKQNQQTVFYKEDFNWHYISFYLDNLVGTVPIDDEEFIKLFKKLQDYVETKVFTATDGEPVDMFVIIERKIR